MVKESGELERRIEAKLKEIDSLVGVQNKIKADEHRKPMQEVERDVSGAVMSAGVSVRGHGVEESG